MKQSKYFVIFECAAGMAVMKGECELASEGDGQASSNMGKGQMGLADFVMNPALQIVDKRAGSESKVVGGVARCLGVGGAFAGDGGNHREEQLLLRPDAGRLRVDNDLNLTRFRSSGFKLLADGESGPARTRWVTRTRGWSTTARDRTNLQ
ncbi:hypothetical protein [Gemmatimonas sp.]|uniref:hypothetical protein n=1 Tax=Gemmatimonas sp. TaxID=1962908 RepID=UPI0033422486